VCKKILWINIYFFLFVFTVLFSGCKSTETSRIDDLVEARIIAERGRIREEIRRELLEWAIEDARRIEESINRRTDRQEAIRAAAEEYRAGYIRLLDRIEQIENGNKVQE